MGFRLETESTDETRKGRNRLYINEITSVGVVAAGDNPPASIEFFKKQPAQPDPPPNPAFLKAVQEYRAAKATYTPTREQNMATKTDPTVNEAAAEAVHWFSYHDVSKRYGKPGERGVTMEMCAAEAWESPLGKELRALMLAYGDQPVSKVMSEIRKDGNAEAFGKALDVIRDGWPR